MIIQPPIAEKIEFVSIRWSLCLPKGGVLPSFKGSMFRGALAGAMKLFVCHDKKGACESCQFGSGCVYSRIFEPMREDLGPTLQHQYVIDCEDVREVFSPGDILSFNLHLFGETASLHAYFVKAMMMATRRGLGGRRVACHSDRITSGEHTIYDGHTLDLSKIMQQISPSQLSPILDSCQLTFKTPFRTKREGRFVKHIDTTVLLRVLVERMIHSNIMQKEEGFAWLKAHTNEFSDFLTVSTENCRWRELERYSNRQKTAMQLGGVIGCVCLEGAALEPLGPLIRLGELTHIGKSTTFGLGKYEIRRD